MDSEIVKKRLKKIFCLPPVSTLLVAIPSFILVIYVLVNGIGHTAIAYIAYVLSAYAMVITVTGAKGVAGWIRQKLRSHPLTQKLLSVPFLGRFISEAVFRAETILYPGLLINLVYAGIKLFSGIRYRSVWFMTLAVYYILLAVVRFFLLRHVRKWDGAGNDRVSELLQYRLCGVVLLLMNGVLTGIIVLVVYQNSSFTYPGLLIYLMALYTFYAVIMAVRNVVKFKQYGSPVMSAAKVISLTAALVSMLSLETAMLTRFGVADSPAFRRIMMTCTGAGVSLIVLGMAVYMIVSSTKQLKILIK